jgi:hypothetical protein
MNTIRVAELHEKLRATRREDGGIPLVTLAFELQRVLDPAERDVLVGHLQHEDCAKCPLDVQVAETLENITIDNSMDTKTITIQSVKANTYEGKFRSLSIFDSEEREYRLQWSDLDKVFGGKMADLELTEGKKYPQVKAIHFAS